MSGWRKRTIVEMARETHLEVYSLGRSKARFDSRLEAFAAMVREDEREECAKVCDDLADVHAKMNQWGSHKTADTLADAIRARGQA